MRLKNRAKSLFLGYWRWIVVWLLIYTILLALLIALTHTTQSEPFLYQFF